MTVQMKGSSVFIKGNVYDFQEPDYIMSAFYRLYQDEAFIV